MMITEVLQLTTSLNSNKAAQLTQELESIHGIARVTFAPDTNRLNVTFDEGRTSRQELVAVLERNAYLVASPGGRSVHGGCCGGGCG